MRSRKNDRRASRLQGWLTYAPASVRSNPVLSDVRTFKGKKRERWLMPVWDMLVHSYSAIGVPHREPQELLAEYPVWQVVFDAEGVPRAFSLAKQTRYGLKAAASGSDGSLDGRDTVKDDIGRRFLRAGEYGEVSGAVEKLVTRAGAPVVCAAYVPEVIGKPADAEEDGQHYSREIRGAGRHTKIMVGRPKRVPTTTYASGECPLPRRAAANPMLLKTPEQWKEYGRMVTAAYARAPMFDEREAWRWALLAKHIERMYKQMLSDIRVEFVAGQPYETAEEMSRKVKKSGVMYISADFNEHPIFTPLQNLQFRAVHDYIVHIANDKSFTLKGEIGSYNAHAKLVPPDALPALYTEVVGQASTYVTTGEFPKQKIAVLPFDPIRIGIELLRAEQPARAAANPRHARRMRRNPSALERALAGDKDLTGASLFGAKLNGADLTGADLTGADLRFADLNGAKLTGADLTKANLGGADLRFANLNGAKLNGAKLTEADLFKAELFEAKLTGADLTEADLRFADLTEAKLNGAYLTDANLYVAKLNGANLTGADLNGAKLNGADLTEADLTGANLGGASLTQANLTQAKLNGANLTDANLTGADLTGANLTNVNLSEALNVDKAIGIVDNTRVVLPVQGLSSAFDKWFGKSKIVNEDGTPKVLYHGTDQAGFTAFSKEKIDAWHPGFFFTDEPELARTYAGSSPLDPFATAGYKKGIYRVYVRMLKPYIQDAKGSMWNSIPWQGGIAKSDDIGVWAKAKKYDGVVIRNVVDIGKYGGFTKPANVYIVFDPTNIKSAAYNQGTWDRKDPDIRHNPNGQPRAPRAPRRARRNESTYPWDASTKVQSLQFDKDVFTADEAKAWAKTHDFKYGKVEVGRGNWLRLRQADPEHFRPSTFRVISFRDGVQAVIAVPKRSHR